MKDDDQSRSQPRQQNIDKNKTNQRAAISSSVAILTGLSRRPGLKSNQLPFNSIHSNDFTFHIPFPDEMHWDGSAWGSRSRLSAISIHFHPFPSISIHFRRIFLYCVVGFDIYCRIDRELRWRPAKTDPLNSSQLDFCRTNFSLKSFFRCSC